MITPKLHRKVVIVAHRTIKRHHKLIKVCLFVGIAYVVVLVTDNGVVAAAIGHVGLKCIEFLGDCIADRVFPSNFLETK